MRPLGSGLDNTAYETADGQVLRFSKVSDPAERAEQVRREARLLAAVAAWSPIAVPVIGSVDAERGCLAYPKLPGEPLLRCPPDARLGAAARVGATLGTFLAALHAVPEPSVRDLVEVDDRPPAEWLAEAAEQYAEAGSHVPPAFHRRIEAFLDSPAPAAPVGLVFSHHDLGIEHVLVEPDSMTVTGVIDWTDAALSDPACDFGLIHRDLGPAALDAALAAYGSDRLRDRAEFYARCAVFGDLEYGLATGDAAYVDKCLAGFEWLFPPTY